MILLSKIVVPSTTVITTPTTTSMNSIVNPTGPVDNSSRISKFLTVNNIHFKDNFNYKGYTTIEVARNTCTSVLLLIWLFLFNLCNHHYKLKKAKGCLKKKDF